MGLTVVSRCSFLVGLDKKLFMCLLLVCVDESLYATVSEFWTQLQFFEVIAPDEVAYVYKIKPALDFGVPLVRYCCEVI